MIATRALSGQLYDWSDQPGQTIHRRPAAQTCCTVAKAPPTGGHRAGFADRALQTLWKTRLPLPTGSWPRPKVLSVGQHARHASRHGVRPQCLPRNGPGVRRELPTGPTIPRADLCDQPGAAPPQRGTRVDAFYARRPDRYPCCRHPDGEHGAGLVRGGRYRLGWGRSPR